MVFSQSLTKEEEKILERMQDFVRRQHAHSDSHDYSHVFSVVRYAIMISEGIEEEVDPFVIVAGALLHVIGKTTNVPALSEFHGLFGGAIAEEYLDGLRMDSELRDCICRVVIRHTPTSGIPPETPEEKVVYDADTLDRLGLMGLLRGFLGKEGSMKEILEKYLEKRKTDYEKLNYELSRDIGAGMAQELEGFSFLILKRLDDRLKSISDLLKPFSKQVVKADTTQHVPAKKKDRKRRSR